MKIVVTLMAGTGRQPVYSMGDDTPLAPFGRTRRRAYGYLRQRFAQVTNPPIDPLRERGVMSLRTLVGARHDTLSPSTDVSLPPGPTRRGQSLPSDAGTVRLLELESPVVGEGELARLLENAVLLDATFARDETLAGALGRLVDDALAAPLPILVVSDRRAD